MWEKYEFVTGNSRLKKKSCLFSNCRTQVSFMEKKSYLNNTFKIKSVFGTFQ